MLNFESKEKGCSLLIFRVKVNLTLEVANDQLTNDQAQAYPFSIDAAFGVFECSEHLEHFTLVFLFYSEAVVNY